MTLWNEVLNQLKLELSEASYKTWLGDTSLRPFDENDDTLTIEVPSEFTRNWIEMRYSTLISEAIYQITNEQYKLKFIINPSLQSNNDQQENINTKSKTNSSLENKLNLVLSEIKQMDERISKLEFEIQNLKS